VRSRWSAEGMTVPPLPAAMRRCGLRHWLSARARRTEVSAFWRTRRDRRVCGRPRGQGGRRRADSEGAARAASRCNTGIRRAFRGPLSDLCLLASDGERTVSVPAGARLIPRTETGLAEGPEDGNWVDEQVTINELEAGETAYAQRFIFHISGALEAHFPPVEVLGGQQAQLDFRLPGWDLVITLVDGRRSEHDFGLVVEATPASPPTVADVDQLTRRLFILLSLMASREVGVGPVCGLNEAGEVIWAKWGTPPAAAGETGGRWCPRILVASALPAIANGFTEPSTDEAMEAVVDRAIQHLLAADGSEALDVRVRVACAGLETARIWNPCRGLLDAWRLIALSRHESQSGGDKPVRDAVRSGFSRGDK
jgi:hypothetical protein